MNSYKVENDVNATKLQHTYNKKEIGLSVPAEPPSPSFNIMLPSTRKSESESKEHETMVENVSGSSRAQYKISLDEKCVSRSKLSLQIDDAEDEKLCDRYTVVQTPRSAAVTLQDRALFIHQTAPFCELPKEKCLAVAQALSVCWFRDGEQIIEQGQPGTVFYIIKQGSVLCTHHTEKGGSLVETLRVIYEEGEYFGEGSILHSAPRMADVHAQGDVICYTLTCQAFTNLLGDLQALFDVQFTAKVLKGVKLLESISDMERIAIARQFEMHQYKDGEMIIKQGSHGDHFFIIKRGEISFTRQEANDETPKQIGVLFAGQTFGEGSLLTEKVRRANAFAMGDVEILSMHREKFLKVFGGQMNQLHLDFAKRSSVLDNVSKLLDFGDLQKLRVLGAGTYGQVLIVSHTITGKTYALKCMRKSTIRKKGHADHLRSEKSILEQVNHPNIVNLVQTFAGPEVLYALLEPVLGGEFASRLRAVDRLDLNAARFYAAQVVEVFSYLHANNVIYRDLKPENLLVCKDGYLKLTDFGLAKRLGSGTEYTYTLCGTPAYAAPEVYRRTGHNMSADWWTFGVLFHEMLTGHLPFSGPVHLMPHILEQYTRTYPNVKLPEALHNAGGDLVMRLLQPNPARRMGTESGAKTIREHEVFDGFDFVALRNQKLVAPFIPNVVSMYDTSHFEEPRVERPVELDMDNSRGVVAGAPWAIR